MLLIIVPVMALIVCCSPGATAKANTDANYEPDWDHSTQLELIIWAAPAAHHHLPRCADLDGNASARSLSPARHASRPATRCTRGRDAAGGPTSSRSTGNGCSSIRSTAWPRSTSWRRRSTRPIHFRITASSVMNSFYVPALAGQIYAMPGMETKLHAVINKPGVYQGFSANYSGAGFSGMRFAFHGLTDADFDKWVAQAKAAGGTLNRSAIPRARARRARTCRCVASQASTTGSYKAILNMCVEPGKMCMNEMAAIDAKGGLGLAGHPQYAAACLRQIRPPRRGARARGPIVRREHLHHGRSRGRSGSPWRKARSSAPVAASPLVGAGPDAPAPPPFRFSTAAPPASRRPSNS